MKKPLPLLLSLLLLLPEPSYAFCGFYVAKADTKIFNKASQVAIVRDENKTVLTMANDFKGDPKEFAIVIPVPTIIQRNQINVADKALLDHLDAYSAPRLVEYFDGDPCEIPVPRAVAPSMGGAAMESQARRDRAKSLGVTIEAAYTVGEYDILILSAKQSDGLQTWLVENGYRMPAGATRILGSYIKQNMKFFVAKVNLKEQSKLGFKYLRPIQVAFNSPKFMLPIRLGTLNANGTQELFIYTLTRRGRVETTNYRTVRIPTGQEIPVYVKNEFAPFYKSMFNQQVLKEQMMAVFLEYAWDMNWCDPCAADPLSDDELRKLGVFWIPKGENQRGAARDVFITRLHVRYDQEHFPEDLMFQETGNRENFQGRYVLRHPWTGKANCPRAKEYQKALGERRETEARNLAQLTGWKIEDIRRKMNIVKTSSAAKVKPEEEKSWWDDLWD